MTILTHKIESLVPADGEYGSHLSPEVIHKWRHQLFLFFRPRPNLAKFGPDWQSYSTVKLETVSRILKKSLKKFFFLNFWSVNWWRRLWMAHLLDVATQPLISQHDLSSKKNVSNVKISNDDGHAIVTQCGEVSYFEEG